jgi:osmotically-inducible protein OsmY
MTRSLVYTLLLLGMPMLAQPSQTSNPVFPHPQVSPENTALTDQSEQPLQNKADGNERIQRNLQSAFEGDPTLSGAQVEAAVDDQNITLTGTVESYLQHQRVLQLVSPYFSYRTIVDKVTVQ